MHAISTFFLQAAYLQAAAAWRKKTVLSPGCSLEELQPGGTELSALCSLEGLQHGCQSASAAVHLSMSHIPCHHLEAAS